MGRVRGLSEVSASKSQSSPPSLPPSLPPPSLVRTYHDEVTLFGAVLLERLRDALRVKDTLESIHRLVVVPVHRLYHLGDSVGGWVDGWVGERVG